MSSPKLKAVVSWSSGKDSAFALFRLQEIGDFDTVGIVTTVNVDYRRVSIHGVRESLLDMQAKALGLKLYKVAIPANCTNEIYEREILKMIAFLREEGITHFVFGDLYLQDIREYREKLLAKTGIEPLFPLWQSDTQCLAETMIKSGLKAKITCVDSEKLGAEWSGAEFGLEFLKHKPINVDPCGENGEFHTFVYAGPMFDRALNITKGEKVVDRNFVFTDFIGVEN